MEVLCLRLVVFESFPDFFGRVCNILELIWIFIFFRGLGKGGCCIGVFRMCLFVFSMRDSFGGGTIIFFFSFRGIWGIFLVVTGYLEFRCLL